MEDDVLDMGFSTGFSLPAEARSRPLDPDRVYDALILGAGPAGITAAIYLLRKGLGTGILAGTMGGQVAWTSSIENYLGYRLIDGPALVQKFAGQVREFPVDITLGKEASALGRRDGLFTAAAGGDTFTARSLVLATGKRPRRLGVPGEERLIGRGVAYCAICDAPLYRGKTTAVVGGGNSGLEAAIDLARLCPRVYLVERGAAPTGDRALAERVAGLPQVEIISNASVVEILGEETVNGLRFRRADSSAMEEVAVEGVFVEVGLVPNSEPFREFVACTPSGEVDVDCRCHTSVPGVFAAGDVTAVPYKQIIIAAGEGAKAGLAAYEHVLRGGA